MAFSISPFQMPFRYCILPSPDLWCTCRSMFRSKTFYKYLFSYIAILMLPLFGLPMYYWNSVLRALEKKIIQISKDRDLQPFGYRSDVFRAYKFIREIGRYKALNTFRGDLLVIFRGDGCLYREGLKP